MEQCFVQFACPACKANLNRGNDQWLCPNCGVVGRQLDGIPTFNDPQYYWGEIPREEMQLVNQLADTSGWKAAVEETVSRPELRKYILGPGRADFQYVWDSPSSAAVLDVGAGWGAIASELGQSFARVTAVEGVFERTRFIAKRVRQEGLHTVQPVCADFLRLPLQPCQFDVIVLNGVLEWVGLAYSDGDPRELQLRFLRSITDLLKPGGLVCLGIENRVGLAMFRGGGDHSGLAYTSLMPRWLAHLYCSWRKNRYRSKWNSGYRTYTYSLRGYRKLFRDAELTALRTFHAYNGYNHPSTLLPLENKQALIHFVHRLGLPDRGWKGRIREKLMIAGAMTGLWAQTASEFIFLLKKA